MKAPSPTALGGPPSPWNGEGKRVRWCLVPILKSCYILDVKGKLYTDGGARGNPGPAGIGAVIEGPKPLEVSEYIGETTNNVAEYKARVEGLKAALDNKYNELDIYADSELMVKQIKGDYRVKNAGLKPLYNEAIQYLQKLNHYTIQHVYRENNKPADRLVNEAIDNALL